MIDERRDTTNTTEHPSGPRMLRLFIALETNAPMQAAMLAAQQTLQRRGGGSSGNMPVRWTPPAQMHLTLQFLGNVMAVHVPALNAALQGAVSPHAALMLGAGEVGAFPNTHVPRVLWLDVRGDVSVLMALQRDVARAVRQIEGMVADRKPFNPHLTLGRVREGKRDMPGANTVAAALARPVAVPVAAWPVHDVALIRSVLGAGGPRYTVLERFPLRGGETADARGPTF